MRRIESRGLRVAEEWRACEFIRVPERKLSVPPRLENHVSPWIELKHSIGLEDVPRLGWLWPMPRRHLGDLVERADRLAKKDAAPKRDDGKESEDHNGPKPK